MQIGYSYSRGLFGEQRRLPNWQPLRFSARFHAFFVAYLAVARSVTILVLMAKKRPTKKKTVSSPSQKKLEKLDREILELINRRAEMTAKQVERDSKKKGSAAGDDTARVRQIVEHNTGPLEDATVQAIFRELQCGSRAISPAVRVAYLGPEHTFSHQAAIERFGLGADLVPVGTIAAVFEEVERGQSAFGLVPIENSTDGRIADALECLAHCESSLCGEVLLRVRHCLLGIGTRKQVKQVFSKPQALSQCRKWLSTHLPEVPLHEVASTAEAARKAAQDPQFAAIASRQAGVEHSLAMLAADIQDHSDNITRFAVIGTEPSPRTGNDKTTIVFELDHRPGALADSMGIFKRNRLNLTWIESFPLPGQRGRYLFFVEFQGHAGELRPRRAIASLEKKATRLTVLGSYAQAEPIG